MKFNGDSDGWVRSRRPGSGFTDQDWDEIDSIIFDIRLSGHDRATPQFQSLLCSRLEKYSADVQQALKSAAGDPRPNKSVKGS